ncbi:MAG: hypothetical protein NW224_12285 [Leptolyngbyaceae cyanobacterium bins.302]|nr:hypothetical protein [Leptolyngbyaceae cyanobacterium bins.302]
MSTSAELDDLMSRIKRGQVTENDLNHLRELFSSRDQNVSQQGKYGINLGEGKDIQIGDRIYQGADADKIRELIQEALASVREEATSNSQSARQGLNALTDLMSAPKVRDAVAAFRTDFEAACEQITLMGDYKDLHDLLHDLEFRCYKGLMEGARRFQDDETTIDILTDHELTLQDIIDKVRETANRESVATQEITWLKDLKQAQQDLHAAIQELDQRRLKGAIWALNRVLAIQPSRINDRLNQAARALRLPALVKALAYICSTLSQARLDIDKIKQFEVGVQALSALEVKLTALVKSHNWWQELDLELRRIEANLETDTFELEMSWVDLQSKTVALYTDSADEWAIAFKKDSDDLNQAITDQNPVKIRRFFRTYRRRAGDRFYRVDVDLKRLCGELRTVGDPLASVLRMIE